MAISRPGYRYRWHLTNSCLWIYFPDINKKITGIHWCTIISMFLFLKMCKNPGWKNTLSIIYIYILQSMKSKRTTGFCTVLGRAMESLGAEKLKILWELADERKRIMKRVLRFKRKRWSKEWWSQQKHNVIK